MTKVFLGGTCNGSNWRSKLKNVLKIEYFDPVVDDWTPECQAEEIRQRQVCDFCLYVITPKITGYYAIAEAVDDSNKIPKRTIFCVLEKDGEIRFTPGQMKSLEAVGKMIRKNGGAWFGNLEGVAQFLNRVWD